MRQTTSFYCSAANLKYFQTSSLPSRVSADVTTMGAYPTWFAFIVSINLFRTDSVTLPGFFSEDALLTFLSAFVKMITYLALFLCSLLPMMAPTFCIIFTSSSVGPILASTRWNITRSAVSCIERDDVRVEYIYLYYGFWRENSTLTFSLRQILIHEVRPILFYLLGNFRESESGKIHDIERITVFRSKNIIAIADLTRKVGFIIDCKVIELLGLPRSFAYEC